MAPDLFEQIERQIWREEKKYLMKHVSLSLIRNDALKIGDYILHSGKKSPYYVDLRQSISDHIAMDWIGNSLARIVINEIGRAKVDKVMGVPTAGVPFATIVSQKLAIPMLYYRKERKEHGVRKKVEGNMERNDRILMIDDLITTGQSVIDAAEAAREQGGIVTELVVLLDREQGGSEYIRSHNIEPHVLFNISEAFEWLNEVKLLDKEKYRMIMDYIESEKKSAAVSEDKEKGTNNKPEEKN
ncbi:MAG: orotate phosphoribosyltransferase [Deltaproteobacteria bacterium]|nr:orotate phosphoribosyltransferase [Deltaproteobacteria bacterium]MBW2137871.1 orotate phosphoribosyltransferase [Deltaproteobacteria bacterium]